MMATLLLADAAQSVGNKLYVLGGGWSVTTGAVPFALALYLKVPWDEANVRHTLELELVDSDGDAVMVPGPDGAPQPMVIGQEFEVGRPPGLQPGTPIDLAMALNFAPIPLPGNDRFEWRLTIDGRSEAHWHAAFSTRAGNDL